MRTHGGVGISESGGHASEGTPVSVAASFVAEPEDEPPDDEAPDVPDEDPPEEDVVDASAPDVGVLSSSPHAAVSAVVVSDTPARTTAE
jgi:hypothetical protein